MKINEVLSKNILIVDVQPAYDHHCKHIVSKVCKLLNENSGRSVVLYNSHDYSQDHKGDVIEYYLEHGLEPNLVDDGSIHFVPKEYGFLRPWMDLGISDELIVKVLRLMVQERVNDSRQLDLEDLLDDDDIEELNSNGKYWRDEPLYLPEFIEIAQLRQFAPFLMAGGGRYECLKEVELICEAFDIKYELITSLIYG
jgi:hypothetical protein